MWLSRERESCMCETMGSIPSTITQIIHKKILLEQEEREEK